jgi:hypothetical protein
MLSDHMMKLDIMRLSRHTFNLLACEGQPNGQGLRMLSQRRVVVASAVADAKAPTVKAQQRDQNRVGDHERGLGRQRRDVVAPGDERGQRTVPLLELQHPGAGQNHWQRHGERERVQIG